MYVRRTIEQSIRKLGESFPCIVIYGARQVGKSTTINHIFGSEYTKVTLDDLEDRELALQNPKLFLDTYDWPLIIDEIQKAPKMLDIAQMTYERNLFQKKCRNVDMLIGQFH